MLFFSITFSSGGLTVLYTFLQLTIFLFLLLSTLYLAFPFYCILLNFLLSFSCLLLSLLQFMLCFLFNVSSSISCFSSIPFNFCQYSSTRTYSYIHFYFFFFVSCFSFLLLHRSTVSSFFIILLLLSIWLFLILFLFLFLLLLLYTLRFLSFAFLVILASPFYCFLLISCTYRLLLSSSVQYEYICFFSTAYTLYLAFFFSISYF